jgi:hypothetical protein
MEDPIGPTDPRNQWSLSNIKETSAQIYLIQILNQIHNFFDLFLLIF